jgi:cytochrome c oxidase assembly protein subunit 15
MNNLYNKKIAIWLFICSFFVFSMVFVGGLTRLTESGLSMTNWHTIKEIIPPLNKAEWQIEFNNYKQSPEFIKKNYSIKLNEFKNIFYWEWAHRLLGRITGLVFLLPFLYFIFTKQIAKQQIFSFFILFILGGLQGLIGWWMVKSGLVDKPDVSHFRLAIHLTMALILFSALFYFALKHLNANFEYETIKPINNLAKILYLLIFIQIIYGAFLAGLNGGLIYNSWPKMNENFIAPEAFDKANYLINDIATIQFIHRWLAFFALVLIGFLYVKIKRYNYKNQIQKTTLIKGARYLKIIVLIQIILGVFTLIHNVPIILASLHQINSVLLIGACVYIIFFSKKLRG